MPGIPYALKFVSGSTDRVDVGEPAASINMTAWTVMFWAMQPTNVAARDLMAKINAGGWIVQTSGAAGAALSMTWLRATTNMVYTAAGAFVAGVPTFGAVAIDQNAPPAAIYSGNLTTPATLLTNTTAQAGTGTFTSDSGIKLLLGNRIDTLGQGYNGFIWAEALCPGVLSKQQIMTYQFTLRTPANCVGSWRLGANGRGIVYDALGRNHGTITGAIPTSDYLPGVGWSAA